MAVITFSSPIMEKDKTVYAIVGDRGTLLKVARDNDVPIPFDCEDGECGSCLIEVRQLEHKPKMAIHLTEKEKTVLQSIGKITAAQIEEADVRDMAPPYRLACQYFVRDEDILVRFSGSPGVAPD